MKYNGHKNFFVGPSGADLGHLQMRKPYEGLKTINDHTLPLFPELERVCQGRAQRIPAM
jgi:hypothetical protein